MMKLILKLAAEKLCQSSSGISGLKTSIHVCSFQHLWSWITKQEIAANCEKYIRAKDTQVSLMIFSSEFKLVKPFVFLSFIFESTDRYNVFHMTHT